MTGALAAVAAGLAVSAAGRARAPRPRPVVVHRSSRRLTPAATRAGCLAVTLVFAAAGLGVVGVVAGLAATAVVPMLVARAEPARIARTRRALVNQLPWALALLAAALEAGADPTVCLRQVASAVADPLGTRLGAVAEALRLGAPAEDAWSAALQGGGEPLAPLAEAVVSSSADGSALAARLARLADASVDAAATAALAEARRVGVRAVLPLGLCFLPAFVAVGVVPVVVAALTRLHL